MNMARLQDQYPRKNRAALIEKFGYTSPMQVPRITKITLNMGVSEAVADKKVMDNAVGDMTKIAGQKPVVTKAKKAIAGFKIREDLPIGCMVTLRGVACMNSSTVSSPWLCPVCVTSVVFPAAPLTAAVTTTSA
jgi:large subunit ribosomal protein L5